jgi:hypothetical protein
MSRRARLDANWEEPINLGPRVNSPHLDGGPSLSADELTLWFHSFRSYEQGSDIWYCQRRTRGDLFGPAMNAGSSVNTPSSFGESSCAISADGRVLVWTQCMAIEPARFELRVAARQASIGDFASSVRFDDPVNTGSPTSPCLSRDGMTLIYDSSRAGGQGGRDLWMTRRVRKE